ncbi:MAG: hypothetical protein CSA29_00475 [Desulfobacterales bacterium]|nr:MAG: hypothetical protein CSA29_00475 [Desulfobacterales bacterium]
MKKIIIGGLSALVGIVCISTFFSSFLGLIAGTLPIVLILGGGIAFYLGFNEIQEAKKDNDSDQSIPQPPSPIGEETTDLESERHDIDPGHELESAEQEPQTPNALSPDEIQFKGNTETLVFHSSNCKFAHGKKCTAEFASRDNAIEKGYTPCKVCNP